MKTSLLMLRLPFTLFLLLFFITQQLPLHAQLQKWFMNYYEIDFSGTVPQFNSLPFNYSSNPLASSSYRYANITGGMHDQNGNLVFYTVWNDTNPSSMGYFHEVYNSSGNLLGTLVCEPTGQALNIIPFGANMDKYLIIYPVVKGAGATRHLDYVFIDMAANAGEGEMSQSFEMVFAGTGVATPTCAVGMDQAGERFVYTNTGTDIRKFIIDFSLYDLGALSNVISPAPIPVVYSFSSLTEFTEIELSPDGTKLALTEAFSNNAFLINLNNTGDFDQIQTFSFGNSIAFNEYVPGAEFSLDNTKLFVSFNHPAFCGANDTTDEGIYVVDLTTGTVSSNPIPNSNQYNRSHLEMGFDGYLYAVSFFESVNENRLARIDVTTEQIVAEYVLPDILPYKGDYRGYNCHIGFWGFFTLPDPVDGESTILVSATEELPLESASLNLFPNPVSSTLNLVLPNPIVGQLVQVQIYNSLGQLIRSELIYPDVEKLDLDLTLLKSGIYHLAIQSSNQYRSLSKFIKK